MAESVQGAEERGPDLQAKARAEMAKKHSSEAFYALDDPPELAVFSVLVERLKVRSVDAKKDKIEKREKPAREFNSHNKNLSY